MISFPKVIELPTAASEPPPKCKRRGRYPAGVISFAREKARRQQAPIPEHEITLARLAQLLSERVPVQRVMPVDANTRRIYEELRASFKSMNRAREYAGLPQLPVFV